MISKLDMIKGMRYMLEKMRSGHNGYNSIGYNRFGTTKTHYYIKGAWVKTKMKVDLDSIGLDYKMYGNIIRIKRNSENYIKMSKFTKGLR